MSEAWTPSAELESLAEAACRGKLDEPAAARLADLLTDRQVCRWYRDRCLLDVELRFLALADRIDAAARATQFGRRDESRELKVESRADFIESPTVSGQWPVVSGQKVESGEWRVESEIQRPKTQDLRPDFPAINLQIILPASHAPHPSPLAAWAISYSVATVFLAVALLGAWFTTITHHSAEHFVSDSRSSTAIKGTANDPSQLTFVGHVSGIIDCRWSDPKTETVIGAGVALDRRYALSSGLMEITYHSGAKVILQGPCDYKVESARGGFLGVGKLVARVGAGGGGRGTGDKKEERGERREESEKQRPKTQDPRPNTSGQWPVVSGQKEINHKSEIRNQKSPVPRPSSPAPLFSVRTPTALVEDLGTEFGVEVSDNGETSSHVFQGQVVMRAEGREESGERRGTDNQKSTIHHPPSEILLSAGQSARVRRMAGSDELSLNRVDKLPAASTFARQLVGPTKTIDLLDIVCGGDGTGKLRERGIDPGTGEISTQFDPAWRGRNSRYLPISWSKFIDGVFMPDGISDQTPLDSAGHTFGGFPYNLGNAWGTIWARGPTVTLLPDDATPHREVWVRTLGAGERYMPDRRGLLAMAPNVGLSFDLREIAAAHPDTAAPTRFRAVAGLTHAEGLADVWVFVDGRPKVQRRGIQLSDGPIRLEIPLTAADRFLTLAVTDGGNTVRCDHVVFGDPVLWLTLKPDSKEQEK